MGPPEWIALAGTLIVIGGFVWSNGRFCGKVTAELRQVRRDVNGPLREHIEDTVAPLASQVELALSKLDAQKDRNDAFEARLNEKDIECGKRGVTIAGLVDYVERRRERQGKETG